MKRVAALSVRLGLAAAVVLLGNGRADEAYRFHWSTVVNSADWMPKTTCGPAAPHDFNQCPQPPTAPDRKFNSFNQPSVNADGVVVMRARSKGGVVHGVFVRDMGAQTPACTVLDRSTFVPEPNNQCSLFVEPPSFPRIDISSGTIATRGNHQPAWRTGAEDEPVGTTGIYTNPFGSLITGASKLGGVPDFSFFEVPGAGIPAGTPFDVFPGSPAVTGDTIVFKGNYTVSGSGRTGVYYRKLTDADHGGTAEVTLIADSSSTHIPGTTTVFGSTAPPSAAAGQAVFAGFDDENDPRLGGIYIAPLNPRSRGKLGTLVAIGSQVPGEPSGTGFTRLGEAVSFDGRFVGFWGAWGDEMRPLRLYCPTMGNKARIEYCNSLCSDPPCHEDKQVPVHQGFFVHDTAARGSGATYEVAKTGSGFEDFLSWNYTGMVPGAGEGMDDSDGEAPAWRSAAFIAVSGSVHGRLEDSTFHAAFKARSGTYDENAFVYNDVVDGIYLLRLPGNRALATLIQTGMDATLIDPAAVDPSSGKPLPITEMGIERDGFRGRWIAVNVSMGEEDAGWVGVYVTDAR